MSNEKVCCFFGHRKIDKTPELIDRLTKEIEVLITEKDVRVIFLKVYGKGINGNI